MPAPAKSRMALWLGVAAVVALVAGFISFRKNRRAAILRLSPLEQASAKPCGGSMPTGRPYQQVILPGALQMWSANLSPEFRHRRSAAHHGGIFQMVIQ